MRRLFFRLMIGWLLAVAALLLTACGAAPKLINTSYGTGSKKVLVAYATYAGSTAEVADAIGKALATKGLSAEVRPIQSVTDPAPYAAVVLGSAIRMGKVHSDVLDFVKKHKAKLADMPVAYFVVCMTMKDETPEARREATSWIGPLEKEVRPVDVGLFAGKLDRAQLSVFDSTVTRFAGGTEGDWRDWDAIRTWAEQAAGRLRKSPAH
jgi:menaquinone-dependent protoporphyrinogen oxidase